MRFRGLPVGSPLANEDPGKYVIGDEASEENRIGETRTFNQTSTAPGWRYGFTALLEDGTRVYSEMQSKSEGEIAFDIPDGAREVYFIVLGAPEEYVCHIWDNDESTDAQMPFEIQIEFEG